MLDTDPVWAGEVDEIEPGRVDELGRSHADLNRALRACGLWERFDGGVEARTGGDDDARVHRVEHEVSSREEDLAGGRDDRRGRHGGSGCTGKRGNRGAVAGKSEDAGVIKVRLDALVRYSAPVWAGGGRSMRTGTVGVGEREQDAAHSFVPRLPLHTRALRRALRASCHRSWQAPAMIYPWSSTSGRPPATPVRGSATRPGTSSTSSSALLDLHTTYRRGRAACTE